MIKAKSTTDKEIVSFIRSIAGIESPIYRTSLLKTKPTEKQRIEYDICNFVSTGQIYKSNTETETDLNYSAIAEYRCQLIINVLGSPAYVNDVSGEIAMAIQSFTYLSQFITELSLKNESMHIDENTVEQDGVLYKSVEIIIDANIALEFNRSIDWFNRVEDIEFNIKEV